MNKKETNISRKITKVSLVIYSSIMFALAITFLVMSFCLKNMPYLWGYLLCLGPSLIFMIATFVLSTSLMINPGAKKSLIAWHIILYFIKYVLIIGIPIIGIWKEQYFNRWSMLATTLIAPILVIVAKAIFANIVSKKDKK